MPEPIVYDIADRPCVEVLVDGTWHQGLLRAWFWRDEAWVADCSYSRDHDTHLDTFPADYVREDTVDRSLGRG